MRGRDAKTYLMTEGTWESPTWTEVKKIINETITPSADVVAGGSREFLYEDNDVTNMKFEWSCTYEYRKHDAGADAVYVALLAAYTANTKVVMAFMDDAITTNGARGWKSPILLDQMPIARDLGAKVEVTVHGVGCLLHESGGETRHAEAITVSSEEPTTTTTPGL